MKRAGLLVLLAGGLAFSGCGESDSDGASLATVRGTVTLHGEWPTQGAIQVSLFSVWHTNLSLSLAPQGPPEFHTEDLGSTTPGAMTHLVEFEIPDINPGSYPSLVVGWRNGGVMGLDEPVLGLYGANLAVNDSLPTAITLAAGQDLEFNFEGWLDRIPNTDVELLPGQLGGTVTFDGGWPTDYPQYLVVFMASTNPFIPSSPWDMQEVTAANPDFLLELDVPTSITGSLAVYGFPFNYGNPGNAFKGGYGWDWSAATPALTPLTLQEDQSGYDGLVLSCRPRQD
jgi:hypothetical protein